MVLDMPVLKSSVTCYTCKWEFEKYKNYMKALQVDLGDFKKKYKQSMAKQTDPSLPVTLLQIAIFPKELKSWICPVPNDDLIVATAVLTNLQQLIRRLGSDLDSVTSQTASDWISAFKEPNVCTQRFSHVWLLLTTPLCLQHLREQEILWDQGKWAQKLPPCPTRYLYHFSGEFSAILADKWSGSFCSVSVHYLFERYLQGYLISGGNYFTPPPLPQYKFIGHFGGREEVFEIELLIRYYVKYSRHLGKVPPPAE